KQLEKFDSSIEKLTESYTIRKELYQKHALFIANACNNLFRAYCRKAEITSQRVETIVFDYLEEYREIICYVLGEDNSAMLTYYAFFAKACQLNGDNDRASMYVRECYRFENTTRFNELRETIEALSGLDAHGPKG
ncbi:MAG: hypothetical protein II697_07465, partial [Clostridia bacterium]|nr:hypothetical protein [Clostridia bacterium]